MRFATDSVRVVGKSDYWFAEKRYQAMKYDMEGV